MDGYERKDFEEKRLKVGKCNERCATYETAKSLVSAAKLGTSQPRIEISFRAIFPRRQTLHLYV